MGRKSLAWAGAGVAPSWSIPNRVTLLSDRALSFASGRRAPTPPPRWWCPHSTSSPPPSWCPRDHRPRMAGDRGQNFSIRFHQHPVRHRRHPDGSSAPPTPWAPPCTTSTTRAQRLGGGQRPHGGHRAPDAARGRGPLPLGTEDLGPPAERRPRERGLPDHVRGSGGDRPRTTSHGYNGVSIPDARHPSSPEGLHLLGKAMSAHRQARAWWILLPSPSTAASAATEEGAPASATPCRPDPR